MAEFLVETALLSRGLASISQEELKEAWTEPDARLVWVDQGKICTGTLEEFLPFRPKAAELVPIDYKSLPEALEKGLSGALTASGAMAVCQQREIPLAVGCGMGGLKGKRISLDMVALVELPVILLATAIKDTVELPASLSWLRAQRVQVLGVERPTASGHLFCGPNQCLMGTLMEKQLPERASGMLILNPIPEAERIHDRRLLSQGMAAGEEAEANGHACYGAANALFDQATEGQSSRLQLQALIANVKLAAIL